MHRLDAGDFLPACVTRALAYNWLLTALVGSVFLAWRKQPPTPTFAVFASMGLMSPQRVSGSVIRRPLVLRHAAAVVNASLPAQAISLPVKLRPV